MKKLLLTSLIVLGFYNSQAQYFQRQYNFDFVNNILFNERWNGGIRSVFNYSALATNYYWTGIGVSFNSPTISSVYRGDRMRFSRTYRSGAVSNNYGYEFRYSTASSTAPFNSEGNSIAEVDNTLGTGGYVTAGKVSDNLLSGAVTSGGSDALLACLSNTGGVVNSALALDVSGAFDVATCIRRSSVFPNKYLFCGWSKFSGTRTDCFVGSFSLTAAGGITIGWCFSYNFGTVSTAGNISGNCRAYSLCEDPIGNIYVVGTIDTLATGAFNIDGLAFALTPAGLPIWQNSYDAGGSVDDFRSVRFTSDINLIVGGFSNATNPFLTSPNMLLTKLTPAGGLLWYHLMIANSNSTPVTYFPSKCYDVVERINTAGSQEYYMGGLTFPNTVQLIYKVNNIGFGMSHYLYNFLPYDNSLGIDYANTGLPAPGVGLFSSISNTAGGFTNSHLLKTYFNGATCTNLCVPRFPQTFPVTANITPLPVAVFTNTQIHTLAYKRYSYQNFFQCTQTSITCGSNVRVNEDEAEMESPDYDQMNVYPNPAYSDLNVALNLSSGGTYSGDVIDLSGKVVASQKQNFEDGVSLMQFNISNLPQGVYMLHVYNGNVSIKKSFIKQ